MEGYYFDEVKQKYFRKEEGVFIRHTSKKEQEEEQQQQQQQQAKLKAEKKK